MDVHGGRRGQERGRSPGQVARQLGQGSLELVGLVVLAALLVGGTVWAVANNGEAIKATVSTKICEITGGTDCGGVPEPAPVPSTGTIPTYLDPSLTPEQQAESGEYVALGDSFSSGEGGSQYDPETDENYASEAEDYYDNLDEDGNPQPELYCHQYGCIELPVTQTEPPYVNMCHRSEGAYSQQVNQAFDFAGGYTFAACSGAVTADFTEPNGDNDGEPAQLDNLDEDTSLVTFTIGGNDAKFADTLTGCIEAGINPFSQCLDDDDERERVEQDIQRAIDNLRELLPQVRERAPNARILVLGYPRFFPEDPGSGWSDGTQIDTEDILAINDLVADMDAQIEGLVDELNEENPGSFQFVDMYDAFNGCEIGTDNPCMNNIEVRFADGKPDKNGSYHPNDAGHDQMAEILEEAIRNGP
jgi:lysophospholipase L1-like esterase